MSRIYRAALAAMSLVFMLALGDPAWASTWDFTVSGRVSGVWDSTGLASQAGVKLGDTLEYTFSMDLDQNGNYALNGYTYDLGDNTFYASSDDAKLLGGTDILGAKYHYGQNNAHSSLLQIDTGYSLLVIKDFFDGADDTLENWAVGDQVDEVVEMSYSQSGVLNQIQILNAKVVARRSAATPIPAAGLIFGVGLGGLAIVRRRISKA